MPIGDSHSIETESLQVISPLATTYLETLSFECVETLFTSIAYLFLVFFCVFIPLSYLQCLVWSSTSIYARNLFRMNAQNEGGGFYRNDRLRKQKSWASPVREC